MSDGVCLWTIGHSNYRLEDFVALLKAADIEVVADVRSQPHAKSEYVSHFNREPLSNLLKAVGLNYLFLGNELGGRPREQEFYTEEGHVLYGDLAQSDRFIGGVSRLVEGTSRYRVAIMCSEEDPTHCHRRRLIAWGMTCPPPDIELPNPGMQFAHSDIEIIHLRGDGTAQTETELRQLTENVKQPSLWKEGEPWISTQSASPNTQQRAFSVH